MRDNLAAVPLSSSILPEMNNYMISENIQSTQVTPSEIRQASGFVRPPVNKKARLSRRWALPHQVPLCRRSCKGRPGGRRLKFNSVRHEMTYRAWASKMAASQAAANVFRASARGLVKCDISHREGKISVFIHADLVKVKRTGGDTRGGGGLRAEVRGFSHEARRRMLEAMACTHDLDTRPGLFITLTYPDIFPDAAETWHRDLDVLIKRVRRIIPHVGGFWRLELKPRLSGENEGVFAPHFHLTVFTPDKYKGRRLHWLRLWFSLAWYEIVNSGDERHKAAGTNVRTIYNRAHAMRYCSKYQAKDGLESFAVGRRWGAFGELDRSATWTASISRQAFYVFRRYAVRLLASRGRRYAKKLAGSSPLGGFTVFGMGSQSQPDFKHVWDSSVYALLIDAVHLARSAPREVVF